MVHLYCGEGKGKTTAAMGLALRMAGRGRAVVIAQFLKGADSGERLALAQVPGVRLLEVPERVKFSFQLTPAEREAERTRNTRLLALARKAAPSCDLLVRRGEHRAAAAGGCAGLPGFPLLRGGPHRPGPGPGAPGPGGLSYGDEEGPAPL